MACCCCGRLRKFNIGRISRSRNRLTSSATSNFFEAVFWVEKCQYISRTCSNILLKQWFIKHLYVPWFVSKCTYAEYFTQYSESSWYSKVYMSAKEWSDLWACVIIVASWSSVWKILSLCVFTSGLFRLLQTRFRSLLILFACYFSWWLKLKRLPSVSYT